MDRVRCWQQKTEISVHRLIGWLGLPTSKFYDWQVRYGKVNEHNGWVPRDFWLETGEKQAILEFHRRYPLECYRRLTFMMLDADIVAVSPASVWRVLHQAGRLSRWHQSLKGECLRPGVPLSLEDAQRVVGRYAKHYNTVRLHSAIGYVTPWDMLTDRQVEIHAARDRKLEEARRQRQLRRQQAASVAELQ